MISTHSAILLCIVLTPALEDEDDLDDCYYCKLKAVVIHITYLARVWVICGLRMWKVICRIEIMEEC